MPADCLKRMICRTHLSRVFLRPPKGVSQIISASARTLISGECSKCRYKNRKKKVRLPIKYRKISTLLGIISYFCHDFSSIGIIQDGFRQSFCHILSLRLTAKRLKDGRKQPAKHQLKICGGSLCLPSQTGNRGCVSPSAAQRITSHTFL